MVCRNILKNVVLEHVVMNEKKNRYWIVPEILKDKPYLNKIIDSLETLSFRYLPKDKKEYNPHYRILNIFNDPEEITHII